MALFVIGGRNLNVVQLYQNCSTPKLTVQQQDTAKIMKRMPYSVLNVKLDRLWRNAVFLLTNSYHGFAASQVVDVATLEVKCSITGKDMSPEELVKKKKGQIRSFWHYNEADNLFTITIKKTALLCLPSPRSTSRN